MHGQFGTRRYLQTWPTAQRKTTHGFNAIRGPSHSTVVISLGFRLGGFFGYQLVPSTPSLLLHHSNFRRRVRLKGSRIAQQHQTFLTSNHLVRLPNASYKSHHFSDTISRRQLHLVYSAAETSSIRKNQGLVITRRRHIPVAKQTGKALFLLRHHEGAIGQPRP
ncbi:uncharacterized protein BCR38DRAFT_405669 [Pseudomassariella vexata]|uniref:Uncharacterized protein n=1 Tax=Pseudomassariella vexata TaxID=1141098 RepID=A0A1Y2EGV1_9PEZI|nr:uncharacterized protein BCR38DRAFT_405669 [Pseudomassariella vexata]ORY70015.1 hypothetical protein BCR38DRAFT_405669 [Pseudomassariella vexata]